jgi:choice-of-anchor C domain-containing protein
MDKKLLAAFISTVVCSGAQANLITNGDFEAAAGAVAPGSYTIVAAGATTIPGWTVTGTTVDLINGAFGAPSGVAIDLHGTPGPGKIEQSFAVVAGTTYNLSFDLAGNGAGPHTLSFNFGSLSESITYTFTSVQNITRSFYAATTGSAMLSFTPTGGDLYGGPVVDNVNVSAVPLPGSVALLGIGLVAGALRRQLKK